MKAIPSIPHQSNKEKIVTLSKTKKTSIKHRLNEYAFIKITIKGVFRCGFVFLFCKTIF